jgi:hypothetical protein
MQPINWIFIPKSWLKKIEGQVGKFEEGLKRLHTKKSIEGGLIFELDFDL